MTFLKKTQLNRHIFTHTGEKGFRCYYPFCNKSYFNSGKLELHIKKNHNGIIISNNINNINNIFTHNNSNDFNMIAPNPELFHKRFNLISQNSENISISTCIENNEEKKFNFTKKNKLEEIFLSKKNSELFYDEENSKLNHKPEISPNKTIDNEEENYSLSSNQECGEIYTSKSNKNSDYDVFLKIKKINQNKSNNILNNGIKNITSDLFNKKEKSFYKCPFENCFKTYTSPYNLKVHIKTFHLKIKQFNCAVCNQMFNHKCSLINHINKVSHFSQGNLLNENELKNFVLFQEKDLKNFLKINKNEQNFFSGNKKNEEYTNNENINVDDFIYFEENKNEENNSLYKEDFRNFNFENEFNINNSIGNEHQDGENLLMKINKDFFFSSNLN